MPVNIANIVYREWPRYTHFWLTGELEFSCGANPIELPPGSTVNDAATQFQSQIDRLQDERDLKQFIYIPKPMDIVNAANDYLQQVMDNLTDLHNILIAMNTVNTGINNTQNTRAAAVKSAVTTYKSGWVGQFDTEQANALADPAGWKQALKNFVTQNLGSLGWLK